MSEKTLSAKLKKLLENAGLYGEVSEKWNLLSGIVREMKKQTYMDQDTAIYRLAMTIYHAKSVSGSSIISAVEDPAAVYIQIGANDPEFRREIEEEGKKIPYTVTMEVVKTLIAFLVAAYVYHREREEENATSPTTTQ